MYRRCAVAIAAVVCVCAMELVQAEEDSGIETITVTASADASAQGVQPAYAGGQVARGGRVGVFGSQDIMDTPFSITNYTQRLIADQQAASVGDVLQNDSGVRVARGFGNYQQLYLVRGLPVYSDDMSYNGLYGLLPRQYLAAELLERVEVLHGASAFLNGAAPGGSGLGGAVNVSPKRAPNLPLSEFTAGYASGSQLYLATDVARRFGPEQNFGVRFNAVRRNGGTAVDGEHRSLDVFSLGLDYHRERVRISADIGYQSHQLDHSQPSITAAAGVSILPAPDVAANLAQPWTFSNERDVFGTLRAEVDIAPLVTGWMAAGIRDGHEAATFGNPTILDDFGALSTYRFDNTRRDLVTTGEVGLRLKFGVAGISQQLIASAAAYQLNSKNAYAFSNFAGFAGNLYVPSFAAEPPADFFTGGVLAAPLLTARSKTSSVALADQLAFLDARLLLSIGGRYQKIESFSYDYNSGNVVGSYEKSRITPVAGLLFKFSRSISVYGNYIEGLVQGDTAPDTFINPLDGAVRPVVNAGQVFKPYASRQGEVGIKFDGGHLGASLSAFYTAKPVASVNTASATYEVTDYQRNRGVELSFFGEAMPGLLVLGGASYLHAEVAGKQAIGAPQWQSNIGLAWTLPLLHALTVDSRIVGTGTQFADTGNTQTVPTWWRLDVGLRCTYDLGPTQLTLRARIENVSDRNSWVSAGGYPGAGYLVLGTPRTFVFSTSVSF